MKDFLKLSAFFGIVLSLICVPFYLFLVIDVIPRKPAILLDRIVSPVSSTEVYELRMTNGRRCAVAVNILLNNKEPFGSQLGVSCR